MKANRKMNPIELRNGHKINHQNYLDFFTQSNEQKEKKTSQIKIQVLSRLDFKR